MKRLQHLSRKDEDNILKPVFKITLTITSLLYSLSQSSFKVKLVFERVLKEMLFKNTELFSV